jgi:S-adenosyl-L-methionine hydrolase (adenosine-forming)
MPDVPNVPMPPIALLTDFGQRDGYIGVMKGVILGIAPGTPLIDLTHEVAPQDIATGAWVLHTAWRYFPESTIFLCVVDPGVGSARRAIALRAADRLFVGPDNGLFSYILAEAEVERAVALDNSYFHLPLPSATFHGRDIFAPCAAHLARGVALEALGSPVAPDSLVTFTPPKPAWQDDTLAGHVLHIDHFGNLITDLGPEYAGAILTAPEATLNLGDHLIAERARAFAEGPADRPYFQRDSSGYLAIVLRNGSAAGYFGVAVGDQVLVRGLRERVDEDELRSR